MSTLPVQSTKEVICLPDLPSVDEIREGDWQAYCGLVARPPRGAELTRCVGGLLAYKQASALAYLGKRAQFHGGVCSRSQPRIFTPEFIAELERSNKAKRYQRYPWLEKLLTLLEEIENLQEQVSNETGNVFTLK
ncbi:hypothetical protein BH11PSE11_BH11PSE11_04750 [soil metagenome]